jgi:phosphotriesterase-related protein
VVTEVRGNAAGVETERALATYLISHSPSTCLWAQGDTHMRRTLIVIVVVMAMLATAAVAIAKTDLVRQPKPDKVVAEHIDALNNCDVDRLMAQYPETIEILLPGGVTVAGREDVRDLFEGFCLPYPAGLKGLTFTEVSRGTVHKTVNMQWSADACFLAEPYLGADAYETWSGLMAAQVTTFDGAELVENPDWVKDCAASRTYFTTAGPLAEGEVGNILAHDHMFVEFGVAEPVDYLDSTPEEVDAVIGPLVAEAKSLGYDVFVEPTPDGVGRRPDIVKYIADKAEMPTMMVTGVYSEPNIPDWVNGATIPEISDWLQNELNEGVGDTGVPAGFIKLSQGWDGPTALEAKVLEAACDASLATGAPIASHILQGAVALDVIDRLEGFGCDAGRFIWVHAPYTAFTDDAHWLLDAAEKGAYISHDFIGSEFWAGWLAGDNNDARQLELIKQMVDAGYEDQIIIGQDCGWFDPGNPDFVIQDYSHIANVFVPLMEAEGFSPELIQKLMHDNPWSAYSR